MSVRGTAWSELSNVVLNYFYSLLSAPPARTKAETVKRHKITHSSKYIWPDRKQEIPEKITRKAVIIRFLA